MNHFQPSLLDFLNQLEPGVPLTIDRLSELVGLDHHKLEEEINTLLEQGHLKGEYLKQDQILIVYKQQVFCQVHGGPFDISTPYHCCDKCERIICSRCISELVIHQLIECPFCFESFDPNPILGKIQKSKNRFLQLYGKALAFSYEEKWFDAYTILKQLISQRKKDLTLYSDLGYILFKLNRLEEAVRIFDQALSINSRNTKIMRGYAQVLLSKREYEKALNLMEKAIAYEPNNAENFAILGTILSSKGSVEEAIDALKRAIEIDPHDPYKKINYGGALSDNGNYQAAIKLYEEVYEEYPSNFLNLLNWGVAYYYQYQFNKAIDKYKQANSLKPNDPYLLKNWGLSLFYLNRIEDAIEKFEDAEQGQPNDPSILRGLGLALKNAGRLDEAKRKLEKAIKLQSTHPLTLEAYAGVLSDMGNNKTSQMFYNLALKFNKKYGYKKHEIIHTVTLKQADFQKYKCDICQEYYPISQQLSYCQKCAVYFCTPCQNEIALTGIEGCLHCGLKLE